MGAEQPQLHVFLFPLMAHGHMIPIMDIARSFAQHGVTVSIITTPANSSYFKKCIDRSSLIGHQIQLLILHFPCSEAGLPDGCESLDLVTDFDMAGRFWKAVHMLQQPLEKLFHEHLPNCIVSDLFLPWTVDVAEKFGIPRLSFSGSSFFASCAFEILRFESPHENVASDEDVFVLPGLPHRIEMTRLQLPDFAKDSSQFTVFHDWCKEAEDRSYGFLMNSFYELEVAYVDDYKERTGKKVWSIGPVSLFNREVIDKASRGKTAAIDETKCLKWLDSMEPNSVVYICFGSGSQHIDTQLHEIALALESSDRPFIWVVRNCNKSSSWLPEGFEERIEGKGLIIRGWAPQILILNHPSIGAFVTHCGWNSVLEGVSAGVPLITWPVCADQIFNEMLITKVLRTGVGVGVWRWANWESERMPWIEKEDIEKAIREATGGGVAATEMRTRARRFCEMARSAVEVGGSSYQDMVNLIEELKRRDCEF